MKNPTAAGIGRVVLGADVLRERKVLPALEETRIFVLTSHVLPAQPGMKIPAAIGIGQVVPGADVLRERRYYLPNKSKSFRIKVTGW